MVEELVRTSKLADTGSDHVVGLESHSPHLMKKNIHPRIDNLCNVEKHKVLVNHLHSRHSASQRTLVSSLLPFRFPFLCFRIVLLFSFFAASRKTLVHLLLLCGLGFPQRRSRHWSPWRTTGCTSLYPPPRPAEYDLLDSPTSASGSRSGGAATGPLN